MFADPRTTRNIQYAIRIAAFDHMLCFWVESLGSGPEASRGAF